MIQVKHISGGYSEEPIIRDLSFEVKQGEFFTLLGPNGSGKSTLFKLITGVLSLQSGHVLIAGKPLSSYSALEKARLITVLAQEEQISFDFTVEEIVNLGRYPHQTGFFKTITGYDKKVIEEVLEITKVMQYRHTPFRMLSGGEKQRVLLAKALAQEPKILLLDEPTNHLDIQHSFQMLNVLKEWQESKKLTVFAILHDLNIASLYADRVALLHQGDFLEVGDVNILKKEKQLEKVYQVEVKALPHPSLPKPQLLLTPHSRNDGKRPSLESAFTLKQNEEVIHIEFERPLRTISNGVIGEGIQWIRHFCNFHVDKHYDCSDPQADVRQWMERLQIPVEQAVGMMTAVSLSEMVFISKKVEQIQFLAMVTAGVGNAVDISCDAVPDKMRRIGTINTMVFMDSHLTDGALVNAIMSATEAKTKALSDLKVKDPKTETIATGTSTDSLLIAATQEGEATPYAGSGTIIGKGIGQIVYEATQQAIWNYQQRVERNRELKG
jgi:iron complex transport system ATP-binding protein